MKEKMRGPHRTHGEGGMRKAYKIIVGKFVGKRSHGRPWTLDVKMPG
jgi:hypothetical protein